MRRPTSAGSVPRGALPRTTIDTPDRLTRPLIRSRRPGKLGSATSRTRPYVHVARKFREIIARHGPDAVAFYGSGQLDTEAAYLACKLFKGSIWHQQHRLQQPAVHGVGGGRLPHQPRRRRPALLLRRHRPRRRCLSSWAATWPRPTR